MTNALERIDSYFQGELAPDEKRRFEQAILEDPEFAKQVAFYVSSIDILKQGARNSVLDAVPELSDEALRLKKSRLRDLYEQQKTEDKDSSDEQHNLRPMNFLGQGQFSTTGVTQLKNDEDENSVRGGLQKDGALRTPVRSIWSKWGMVAAACVTTLLVMSIFYFYSGSAHAQLADEFIKTELVDLGVSMGTVADSMITAGNMYNAGNYTGSLAMFEKIFQENPTQVKALEFAGISALQLKNYPKAYQYFGDLAKIDGMYSNPGNFYAAVTLMKQNKPGDEEKAKQLLEQVVKNNLGHSKEAKEWLENW